jgi:hypothetical protein
MSWATLLRDLEGEQESRGLFFDPLPLVRKQAE